MLKNVVNLIAPPTVASVLSSFQRTLDDLENVRFRNVKERERQQTIVDTATEAYVAADKEVAAAAAVTAKIRALISA